ncbi:preprotein translocase subunit SecA [Staphylococcus simulans]
MTIKINHIVNQMRLKSVKNILNSINKMSSIFSEYTDDELKAKTQEFKKILNTHTVTLNKILPEAYAVVRESAYRVLGMYPKDVQVLGAIVMSQGNISEMQTGEGKTLTATFPLYLNALTGKHSFLITTNDYLAKRDFMEMKPLYEFLGLTASLGFVDIPDYEYKPGEKKDIYEHDIIYTTNGRLGFDYLIDNLSDHNKKKFLPSFNFAILDEVDSIILDAAQTPLVISGTPRLQSNLFEIVKEFVDTLIEGKHFKLNNNKKEIWLTTEGINKATDYFKVTNLYNKSNFELVRIINLSMRAKYLFKYNYDYIVHNGKVVLIDGITGRMLPGTKLQSGLHQAIEAKESLEISIDKSVMATITFQNLFKLFNDFAGMTGTGKQAEKEFFELYSKTVIEIPTDKPVQRQDLKDNIFLNSIDKNKSIIESVVKKHENTQPVLLITRTAEEAEYFSSELFKLNIPNNLLIAQNVSKEAHMIAEAGNKSAVTVATSMAGRGTDIKLEKGVHEVGGLAVIINEHMESSRVDKQLRGRAGRQGDPGSSQIFVSLDDYIIKKWSKSKLLKNPRIREFNTKTLEQSRFFQKKVKKIVKKAQVVAEETAVIQREISNEYEKSISIQREVIYKERNRILDLVNSNKFNFSKLAENNFKDDFNNQQLLNKKDVINYIYQNLAFNVDNVTHSIDFNSKENTIRLLTDIFNSQFNANKIKTRNSYFELRYVQKSIIKAIDMAWIEQVDYLQQLKSNVNNRQNGKRNAIFEYHKVALESFEQMSEKIKRDIIRNLCLSIITFDEHEDLLIYFP